MIPEWVLQAIAEDDREAYRRFREVCDLPDDGPTEIHIPRHRSEDEEDR